MKSGASREKLSRVLLNLVGILKFDVWHFQVLTAASVKMSVVRDIGPCGLVKVPTFQK
jgi:hypothetical protein